MEVLSRKDRENTGRVLADGFCECGKAGVSAWCGMRSPGLVQISVWTQENQVHVKTPEAQVALFPLPTSTRIKEHP